MANNLIPVIADCLGVRIGEEFWLKEIDGNVDKGEVYKFTDNFLVCQNVNANWFIDEMTFARLTAGEMEIVKKPFEPKENERYWTYFGAKFFIDYTRWVNSAFDYCHKTAGCVFRTKEEALAARPAKYKELTGKEWQE